LKSAGYLDTHANSNGKSMWGQDEDDTLIDEQFKNLQTNLDTVIGETEKIDELTPVSTKGDKEEKGRVRALIGSQLNYSVFSSDSSTLIPHLSLDIYQQ